jgi:hypothetical protein
MSEIIDTTNKTGETYLTAFVVLITENGTPNVISDLEPEYWHMDHKASSREVRRAILEIAADFQTQAVVESLVAMMSEQKPQTPADIVSDALKSRKTDSDDS